MKSEQDTVSEGRSPACRMTVKSPLPSLHPGLLERFVYYAFEPFWWTIWWWHRGKIHGTPSPHSCIFVSNHGSYLDWILPHVLLRRVFRRRICYLVKSKVVQSPLFRVFTRSTGSIAMQDDKKAAAIKRLTRLLTDAPAGEAPIVGVFPEGTRSRNGEQLPGMRGSAWMARLLHVPMQPVALCGFHEVWPPGQWFPRIRRGKLSVHFLQPVLPQEILHDQETVDVILARIYAVVKQGLHNV